MKTLQQKQAELIDLQSQLKEVQDQLRTMKHDPMQTDLADDIKQQHDQILLESYGAAFEDLPFNVCNTGSAERFAEFVKGCDKDFYNQSLNDFADSFDVEFAREWLDLQDQETDLQDSIDQLESDIWDLENIEENE